MADDGYRKPFRSDDSFGRTTGASRSSPSFSPAPMAPAESSPGASDPLAELARLIGQSDPFAEFGRTPRAPDHHVEQHAAPEHRGFSPFDRSEPTQPGYVVSGEPSQYDTRQYGLPFGAQANVPADYGHHASAQMPAPMTTHAAGMPGGGFHDAPAYDPAAFADQARTGQEAYYDDVPPPRRRIGVLALAGVFALAVIGTAGALGYRALFGSSAGAAPPPVIKADATPSKVVPPAANGQANKLINDRIGDKTQGEKLVSREEQPVDIARQMMTSGAGSAPAAAEGGALYEPKKVKTIAIRPDQPGAGAAAEAAVTARTAAAVQSSQPAPARPSNAPMPLAAQDDERAPTASAPRRVATSHAPLSLTPGAAPAAPAPAPRSAPAPAPAANGNGGGSGYAVQISSQRSEADAQTAFRNMQSRFPGQLGGRQAMIRRADLGSKGVYYRAMVGPFASSNEANELCNSLKAAGGQCIVQRI